MGTGLAEAALWVLAGAFALWLLISWWLGHVIGRSRLSRSVIALTLGVAPLAYFGFGSYQFRSGLEDLRTENQRLVSVANDYLARVCASERRQVTSRAADRSGGVLLEVDSDQKLRLADAPPPAALTARMLSDQSRYGESYPDRTNKLQYQDALYWVHQVQADSVLVASQFAFVEQFDKYSASRKLTTTARSEWWTGAGRDQIVGAKEIEDTRRFAEMSDAKNRWLRQTVATSRAKYLLSLADISSMEDRRHWVARARILLSERRTGAIVAEYIGFAANQVPAYQPRSSYAWEKSKVCPGPESAYERDRTPWDVVGYFFREVVTYE